MDAHEERVIAEKRELLDKTEKLAAFIGGTMFEQLAMRDQALLCEQHAYMTAYLGVLSRRIERF